MPSDLTVSLLGSSPLLQIHSFEYGIFAILLFYSYNRFLHTLFPFKRCSFLFSLAIYLLIINKYIHLFCILWLVLYVLRANNVISCNIYSSYEQFFIYYALIKIAYLSPAKYVILPLQDLLGTGKETRMNMPGTLGIQNWSWRYPAEALSDVLAERIRKACSKGNR